MDTCSREYMFASELITNVMQLYCSTWEPDIKPSYEKDSPFTSTVEEAIHFIWYEKKEFVNDLFSTVLQLGTINVANYEAPVKFASHIVTEAGYDEIELLRYCVIAASYATLFYQNGLADVPDRCLHFIYNTITIFKSKNEFDGDESWFDIELLGHAYCKSFSEDCYSEEGVCFSRKSEGSSSNFQRDVSDRNAVKNENNGPCAIKEPLQTCITSENFSCRATTSKECGTILPRTKNVKRKSAKTKREVTKKLKNSDLNTNATDKNDVPKEVAERKSVPKELSLTTKNKKKCSRELTYRSKKVAKTKHIFPKNTDTKDSFVEVADTKHLTRSQLTSKNAERIGILTKCEATKVKSSNDAAEKYEVIDCTNVENIRDCDKVKEMEYTIKKLSGIKLQINKVTGTKCKSKKVKSSMHRSKNVAVVLTTTAKNADDKYTSGKIKSNKNTFETISNEVTQHVPIGCTAKVCTKNKIAPQELSTINDIKPGIQAICPKTNQIYSATNIINRNKYLVVEVADCKAVAEEFLSSKYVNEKSEKGNDYAQNVGKNNAEYRNVEHIYDNIKKVKQINHASAVEKTYAETIYGNKSKKCEGASYGKMNEGVEETRCASKISTENNNKLKSIHGVKKIKVLKYKNKNVGFKGPLGKSTKIYALNKNLKHKLLTKKPPVTNLINYEKCVDKFAELETSWVNSSRIQYSNENVQFPLATSDKELIMKNTKIRRSPLSKISANYITELEEKPLLKDQKFKD